MLVNQCYRCHSAADGKTKGGLALDSREGLFKGGDSGPAVVPGNPDKSPLIKAVRYTDANLQMPPKGEKLPDSTIADLVSWVRMGAPDPRAGEVGHSDLDVGRAFASRHVRSQSVARKICWKASAHAELGDRAKDGRCLSITL